jgi:octaprenyl-diphosphate synthase
MNQKIERLLGEIEKTLDTQLPPGPSQKWVNSIFETTSPIPLQELSSLIIPVKDILCRAGKRWRPILMSIVCQNSGGGSTSIPLSPLIEFTHNASLIHDDIEDNSELRKGKPAAHVLYGLDTALNAGSFLYFLAPHVIEAWADSFSGECEGEEILRCKAEIYKMHSLCLRRLHLGQAMDIFWHKNFEIMPSLEDYHTMCSLKTGSLAGFACESGFLSANLFRTVRSKEFIAEKEVNEKTALFKDAASCLGVGFQILDDVKNIREGNPGKKRGDDIAEGKKSLPIILFLQENPKQKEMVKQCFSKAKEEGIESKEVQHLIEALENSKAVEKSFSQGKALIDKAKNVFQDTCKDEESLAFFLDFMRLVE